MELFSGKRWYKLIKKADILVIISVLSVIFIVFMLTFFNKYSTKGNILNIYIDGDIKYSYELPLYEKEELEIKSKYGYNKIIIDKSFVYVLEADCNGNDCVKMGELKNSGDFIICAPHRLVIKIENTEDFDAVTY